jgi:hypothetical protein
MQENPLTSIGYPVKTMEDLQKYAPAAFATKAAEGVTDRYTFIGSQEIVQRILDLGWELHSAKQNGPNHFSRHMVRFRHPNLGWFNTKSDNVMPQIILDNSHNRASGLQLHLGLFRLVCTNGLVIAIPGMYSGIKFRHMGVDRDELKKVLDAAAEQYKKVGNHVNDMMEVKMLEDQAEEFAITAIARREPHMFINEDGTINVKKVTASTNPKDIIQPIRGEDRADNLWTVFNVIQERMIKGGYSRITGSGRNSTVRGLTNAVRNVELNKELWTIAESYAPWYKKENQDAGAVLV